jgi:hypothetical protein
MMSQAHFPTMTLIADSHRREQSNISIQTSRAYVPVWQAASLRMQKQSQAIDLRKKMRRRR